MPDIEQVIERLNSFVQCGCCDEEWPQLRHDTVHLIDALRSRKTDVTEEMIEAGKKVLAARGRSKINRGTAK